MIVGLSHRGSFFCVFIIVLVTNNIPDSKRQQTTTVDNKRLINGFFLTRFVSLQRETLSAMNKRTPFDKEKTTKIPFSELVELIGTSCDYKFCIIDQHIDDELIEVAARHGIDLKGYKHVIETTGIQHSVNRHGEQSDDREPLAIEDFLLIPFIIRNRDKVSVSTTTTKRHKASVLVYEKQIGKEYYYVEEIRTGKKSLAFHTLYKREKRNPHLKGAKLNLIRSVG